MTRFKTSFVGFSLLVVAVLLFGVTRAYADDRGAIADSLDKLGNAARSLATTARNSDDRGARRKFATAASDLGDDLKALGRRASKPDVALSVVVQGLGNLDKDALALVDTADEVQDKQERKNLRAQAVALQQQIAQAKRLLETLANRKENAVPAKPAAMTDAAFNQLVSAVRGASFDEDKVGVVKDAARGNHFTANQIATLMGLLAFDEGKIDAAVAAWPRCVDPQNSFVLYKKLAFDDSREQLRKRISR